MVIMTILAQVDVVNLVNNLYSFKVSLYVLYIKQGHTYSSE